MDTVNVSWEQRLEQFRHALRQRDRSEQTQRHYLSDLRQFALWAASVYGHAPDVVQTLDVMAWRQHMQSEQRQAPASVNRRLAALKAFCMWQHEAGVSEKDEGAAVGYVRIAARADAPAVMSHADTLRLLKAVRRETWQGKRDWAIVNLFVQAGLRLGELCDVRVSDLQTGERSGWLQIAAGKGRKARRVPVNATAREAIAEYVQARPECGDDHLFLSQRLRGISKRAVESLVQKHLRAAGIEARVHDLRHLCATNIYESSGHDILAVQQLLGHSNVETTMRYSHRSTEDLVRTVESNKANVLGEQTPIER